MQTKVKVLVVLVFSLVILSTSWLRAQTTANCRAIDGTWSMEASFTDPAGIPPFQVLITFMPGVTNCDGTLRDSSQFQFTPNPVCTQDQGIWKMVSPGKYILTQYNFCFDATKKYAPAGPTKVRAEIDMNSTGTAFTGRQYVEGFDTNGKLVFTGKVNLKGRRIKLEAPPK